MNRTFAPMARRILVLTLIAVTAMLMGAGSVLAGPPGSTSASAIPLSTSVTRDFRATGGYKGTVSGGCTSPDSHVVWFTWQATSTTLFFVSTFGSSYDTVVFVYDSLMNEIGCNDDYDFGTDCPAGTATNHCSRVFFSATSGLTYYIAVAAFDSTKGGKGAVRVEPD